MSHREAETYLSELGATRSLAALAHEVMVAEGCSSYVKTIYVGYDIDGEMVAALYGHADHIEVALALPEDADGHLLVDASHLTWRTLPVAALLRSDTDVDEFRSLAAEACRRVREQAHTVHRDNEFFIAQRRRRGAGLASES